MVVRPDQGDDPDEPQEPDAVEELGRAGSHTLLEHARGPDHRECRADEQSEGARVRALVHARRVGARLVEQGHRAERQRGQTDRHQRHPLALAEDPDAGQEHERPDEVELLFDRQRPQMVERKRWCEAREVRAVIRDREPVVDVEHGSEHLFAHGAELRGVEERDPHADHGEHHEESRKQAARAPHPELTQPELAVPAPVAQQEIRDQVAGEREEHAHAQHPAAGARNVDVVDDDGENRNCANPVQARHVAPAGLNRLGHSQSVPQPAVGPRVHCARVRSRIS